jgi:Arc/MetJ family transcription regulator
MKRTTVDVDETLIEEALKVIDARTYSAVVEKALAEVIRIANLKRGIKAMKDTSEVFTPNYLEEIRPNSWAAYEKRKASYEGREVADGYRPR